MTTKLFAAITLLLCLTANPAWAGEASGPLPEQPLTLEGAVSYAYLHNRNVQAVKQQVQATDEQVRQARAGFFPKLDSHYSLTHLKDQPYVSFQTATGGSSQFPTGYFTTNRWEIDLTQPLFTGFGLTARLQIAEMNLEISKRRLDGAYLDLTRDVKHAFLQSLLAEKLLRVAQDNIKSLEVQRHNAESNYEAGLTARNDVLKADVSLAGAHQRERDAARNLVLQRSQLNRLLDLPLQSRLTLAEAEWTSRPVAGLEQLYTLSEERRPEYLSLETAIRQADVGVTAAESRYYPQLSAFGRYHREGVDFLAETNKYTNNYNGTVGFRVDWNWFEGGKTEAEAQEFRYRRRSLVEQRRDLRLRIHQDVESAYEGLQVAQADIETARVALEQAKENERITTLQYKEQLVIFLEVLNAQVFVLQSRYNYYQALYGYQLALADLERAVGGPVPEVGVDKETVRTKVD